MAIDSISPALLQQMLLTAQQASAQPSGGQAANSAAQASSNPAAATATGGVGSDPAYVLALNQQKTTNQLLAYSQFGKLVAKAESSLKDIHPGSALATVGDGSALMIKYAIDVQQLAGAQSLTSTGRADRNASLGAGTLSLASSWADSVDIPIADGSLDGIAQAINGAEAGITAQVIQSGGLYRLEITGDLTGEDATFQIAGLAGLTFDAGLSEPAQDALFTVNGEAKVASFNDSVVIAPGVTTTLREIGASTLSVPAGLSEFALGAAKLVDVLNLFLQGANKASGDETGDKSLAKIAAQAVSDLVNASFPTASGRLTSLVDLGMSIREDGSVGLDPGELQSAFLDDASGANRLLGEAIEAFDRMLDGAGGFGSHSKAQVAMMLQDLLGQRKTLADYLAGDASAESGSSKKTLASYLGAADKDRQEGAQGDPQGDPRAVFDAFF